MSTFKVKSIWTAFITAFFALLASMGLISAPAANAQQPTATNQEHTAAALATATTPSVRWTLPRDRALPPTMKQRIRAEAHGSSPATRNLTVDTRNTLGATGTTGAARIAHGAPAGKASLLPP
ncbi:MULTISPECIES: DUF6344 domain-containing protein [unclassified Streptomyces]|uniref:DUF6344 domain-containing protein n=1 Tax=unclassified Streptomyces TaxID=2593676 RepID=UPI0029A02D90|nr:MULTISPECIES: DUF6344 domain-containing protein [unclassified Streptomyces]MDX3766731.1 DUF6344 domain-containing protein [Streptomyces sp. AK08-01B]MDX3816847.1 DUF6344 domain-containing protein [Streptomyces sp. AK08-01A]